MQWIGDQGGIRKRKAKCNKVDGNVTKCAVSCTLICDFAITGGGFVRKCQIPCFWHGFCIRNTVICTRFRLIDSFACHRENDIEKIPLIFVETLFY